MNPLAKVTDETTLNVAKMVKFVEAEQNLGLYELPTKAQEQLAVALKKPRPELQDLGQWLRQVGELLSIVGEVREKAFQAPQKNGAEPVKGPAPTAQVAIPTVVSAPSATVVVPPVATVKPTPIPPVTVRQASPTALQTPVLKPEARTWEPRTAVELGSEVEEILEDIKAVDSNGPTQIAYLKHLACRARGILMEAEVRKYSEVHVITMMRALSEKSDLYYGINRPIPLRMGIVVQDPKIWRNLADCYLWFAQGISAYEWIVEKQTVVKPPEMRELGEYIGATQQHLYRTLERDLFGNWDEQQKWLYGSLLDLAREYRFRLESLSQAMTDERLVELAKGIQTAYRHVRTTVLQRQKGNTALIQLRALLADPKFGTDQEGDRKVLRSATMAVIESGIQANNKELLDLLTPRVEMLVDASETPLQTLVREIAVAQGEIETVEEGANVLNRHDLDRLKELLPYTRARKMVFLGGIPLREKQEKIKEVLQLAELEWPETKKTDYIGSYEAYIRKADIAVLLVRFMRTNFNDAANIAKKYDTRVVRLPKGLGLDTIIDEFHQQLVPRR
jgi:hypothetical protein